MTVTIYCFVLLAEVPLEQYLDYTSNQRGNARTGQWFRDPHMKMNEKRGGGGRMLSARTSQRENPVISN